MQRILAAVELRMLYHLGVESEMISYDEFS